MKLPKIILGAIAVFAIAGASLAFKARLSDKVYVATTTDPTTVCTSTRTAFTLAPAGIATQATTILGAACVQTFIAPGS